MRYVMTWVQVDTDDDEVAVDTVRQLIHSIPGLPGVHISDNPSVLKTEVDAIECSEMFI